MDDVQLSGAYCFYRLNILKGGLKTSSYQENILHKHWNLTIEIWELCLGFTWWVWFFFFFFPLHVNILYALMHVYHPSAFAVFSSFWFNIVFNNNVNNLNYRVWTALCQWSTVIEKIIIKASFCIPVCVSWFPMPGGVMILH